MGDEYTKQKRAQKFKLRNKHAKALKEDGAYRIKRVEDKHKRHERLSTNEWMKRIIEKDNDDDE